ncbi:hypothetical protein B0T25DRAFT_566242 [Lasiosphaeria hispida]|uniref:Single-strand DNA deaminase toxin A-like C-terminal domain-containing protein n=1 Tax=Lasiosphaeria hispida TaxID=260671 RepID=A0AAJ0HL46_9PEZI|nr:hypothetical protein B0T25DRAFT_566242 [Lasiosphaeria hispida]
MPPASGSDALHRAILRNNQLQVRAALRAADANVNHPDSTGATPLMVAVLMGRFAITRYLLRKKASLKIRDAQGHSVVRYAQNNAFTRQKAGHYEKLGFRISTTGVKNRRKLLALLRKPEALRACQSRGDHPLSSTYVYRNGPRLEILLKISSTFPGRPLHSGMVAGFISSTVVPRVQMFAVSGWTAVDTKDPNVLHNGTYTAMVRDVAKFLNFKIPASPRDNGGLDPLPQCKGRFFACHVEKQLVVWWTKKVLKAVLGTDDIRRLCELRGAHIPGRMKDAKIFLDHSPCGNCFDFVRRVKEATSINFCLEKVSSLEKSRRRPHPVVGAVKSRGGRTSISKADYDPPPGSEEDTLRSCQKSKQDIIRDVQEPAMGPPGARTSRRREKLNLTISSPPRDWWLLGPGLGKPITRKLSNQKVPKSSRLPEGASDRDNSNSGGDMGGSDDSEPAPREAISTFQGRSAFFASKSPVPRIEVQIEPMDKASRREYVLHQRSQTSQANSGRRRLDLSSFRYSPARRATPSSPSNPAGSKKSAIQSTRKPRIAKDVRLRQKSTFSRAVAYRQHQQALGGLVNAPRVHPGYLAQVQAPGPRVHPAYLAQLDASR